MERFVKDNKELIYINIRIVDISSSFCIFSVHYVMKFINAVAVYPDNFK